MRTDRLLQIIYVINKKPVDFVHLRIDVAGDGNIDEEHGLVLARRHQLFAMYAAENKVRRARRSNHNVSAVAGIVKAAELNRLSVKLVCQPNGAIIGAVSHKKRSGAVGHQMPGRQLAHLPCPYQIDALTIQATENL